KELTELFKNNIEVYKSSRYDEENTKIDFIDKFFALLGWDVYNAAGYSEDFREVIREDKVVIQGRPKSPDYSFKIGRERQFFVEAKKPIINIHEDIKSSYQLRRYAYTAGLSISILTDFEEFAIYDTSIKPKESDNASAARIFYCKYTDYENHWDFFLNTISKQAVLQGKLKKYTSDNTKKKGTQSIDKELLNLIETWRLDLAKNIALRNAELDIYQLNDAVQTIIDRIIFLRMAEDRNTEVYGFLQTIAVDKDIYQALIKYFDSANKKYNSGLFANNPWLNHLLIDDRIFKIIIDDLYYPMPYEFSALPIEILGQIYEQFLGKTIRLTSGHQAKVEEKPEVRKAGGVYYTPKYIVDYIVENTVGKKIENKSPNEIETLTILDPACGSGSFLVGAYKYLLNYHNDFYINAEHIKKALKDGKIYEAGLNDYRLTIREKKKILLNNIYGVDIDKQAVEVTKLSLLLTLMEGEIVESRGELFLKSITEALLPNLDNNIKCGNSLIGTDFYNDKDLQLFDKHEQRKINCFDWEEEFPQVFKGRKEKFDKEFLEEHLKKGVEKAKEAIEIAKSAYQHTNAAYQYAKKFELISEPVSEYIADGGFDIVIGNPPFGADYGYDIGHYLSNIFRLPMPIADSYLMFILKTLHLMKYSGILGLIVPSSWLYMSQYLDFRKHVLHEYHIQEIQLFRKPVFDKVTVEICTVLINNVQSIDGKYYHFKENLDVPYKFRYIETSVEQRKILNEFESVLILNNIIEKDLFNKIKNLHTPLNKIALVVCGLTPYRKGKGKPAQKNKIVKDRAFDAPFQKDETYRKYIMGRDFKRYDFCIKKERWISYGNWLAEPRYKAPFNDNKKIIIRQTSDRIIAHLDTEKYLSLKNVHNLRIENSEIFYEYLLGILNSKLITWWYQRLIPEKGRVFAEVKVVNLKKLPIAKIDFTNISYKSRHDRMVSLVEQMLEAQKEAHSDKIITDIDKKLIQQRIKILDKQIDSLVYELYELTEEEIKIVDGE
ncbi:MAG: hypothetical protein QG635_1721, partial [Bacteroidota bacterium]|nr:hypothetical protein [Bacteroidota bacterium]